MAGRQPTFRQLRYLEHLYDELGEPIPEVETRAGAWATISQAKQRLAHQPHTTTEPAPTPGQLHDLAVLANRLGEPVPQPATSGEAARDLARLRDQSSSTQ